MKCLIGEKACKTYGWAVISGLLFFGSGLLAGGELWPIFVATLIAVLLKTPFYWLWEHSFEYLWHRSGKRPVCQCECRCGVRKVPALLVVTVEPDEEPETLVLAGSAQD